MGGYPYIISIYPVEEYMSQYSFEKTALNRIVNTESKKFLNDPIGIADQSDQSGRGGSRSPCSTKL